MCDLGQVMNGGSALRGRDKILEKRTRIRIIRRMRRAKEFYLDNLL